MIAKADVWVETSVVFKPCSKMVPLCVVLCEGHPKIVIFVINPPVAWRFIGCLWSVEGSLKLPDTDHMNVEIRF